MVSRIVKFLEREVSGLHEAAYLLAFFTVLSNVAAFVRDRLFAHYYGASAALDVYYAAFRLPDFIFVSVASMMSASVLVPLLIGVFRKSKPEIKEFIDSVFSLLSLIMVGVSVAAFFLAPIILSAAFPSIYHGQFGSEFLNLTRIMIISPILLGFSNFLASISQASHRFAAYALSPVLYNLGIIVGVLVLRPVMGLSGLGLGVVLGAFLHLAVQVPHVFRQGLFPRFRFDFNFVRAGAVVKLSVPRTLALSSTHLVTFFLTIMAGSMTVGSIAIFNLAWNLQSAPLAIIGVSYTVALFPTISRLFSGGDSHEFMSKMTSAAKHIIFWTVPVMVLFIVLRAQIVRVIFGSGQFDWTDTRLTAAALALFIVSVLPQSLILLFVRGYYAGGNTRKPFIINIISAGLVIVFAVLFSKLYEFSDFFRFFVGDLLRVEDVPGTEVLMLPLGYSVAVTLNAAIYWFYFQRRFKSFGRNVFKTLFPIFSASIFMGLVSYLMLGVFDNLFDINTVFGIFMQGFSSGVIGIAVLVFVLKLFKNKELADIWRVLHRKIWKADVVVPEQESLF